MTNDKSNPKLKEKKYDLEERTAKLGEEIIDFVKIIPRSSINNVLVGQIVRSATIVSGQTIWKQMLPNQKKIFNTR